MIIIAEVAALGNYSERSLSAVTLSAAYCAQGLPDVF